MRLGDLDALKEDLKHRLEIAKNWKKDALNNGHDEIAIRAEATIDFICEVIMTIDNAPTVTIPHELIEKLVLCVVDTVENIDWNKAIEAYKARPQGEWIARNDETHYCSNCRGDAIDGDFDEILTTFCPHCGAKMKGGEEE